MVRRSKIFTTVNFSSLTFEYLGSFHDAQQYIYSNKHFTIEVNLIIVRSSLSSAFPSVARVVLMSYKTAR
jgi:hypothetical protein